MQHDKRLDAAWWALKIGLGVGAFAAGADKFFNLLADWEKYLSPVARRNLPVTPRTFMRVVGLIEMGAGAVVLSPGTRIGGYTVSAWLLAITANLFSSGKYYDVAVRDAEMAIAAFSLAKLSEVRESVRQAKTPIEIARAA